MAALATRGVAAAQLDVALLERRKYSLTSAGLTLAAADGDVFIPAAKPRPRKQQPTKRTG
jgi:hypothetical protein